MAAPIPRRLKRPDPMAVRRFIEVISSSIHSRKPRHMPTKTHMNMVIGLISLIRFRTHAQLQLGIERLDTEGKRSDGL